MTTYLAGVESKQEAITIMKSFNFVVACQVLVEAWDALTPDNIQKCFSKIGFMPYVECEPESYAEPPPPPEHMGQFAVCARSQCSIC